ncbi:hypothetical protein F9K87_06225 [Brucella anthropi]|uniref:hypothetical protein n=1 Tax=Brucella anthropi TaxID=529 RepID=UPI00124EEEF1|nr:hypothetical protein [Brucella anthropi]KAB2801027.1 hypothetical protein F9K87_06225 [Brucella anthropi]
MAKPKPLRPYAYEKAAFLEDANEDSTLSSAALRVLQKICAAYNRKAGYAECARAFIVDRVPISVKTVQRVKRVLLQSGRIFIVREPIGRASTRYGVNWWFRGADKVRKANDGLPVLDCRIPALGGTSVSSVEGTFTTPDIDTNVPPTVRRGDMMSPKPIISPQSGTNNPTSASHMRALAGGMARAGGEVEVKDAHLIRSGADTILAIHIEHKDGSGDIITIVTESDSAERQTDGQRQLERMSIATNITIEQPSDLIGARFVIGSDGSFEGKSA